MRLLLTFALLLVALSTSAAVTIIGSSRASTAAAAGGGSLTLISTNFTVFNSTTSPKTTSSFTVQAGDIGVAGGICEGDSATLIGDSSSGALTWTLQEDVNATGWTRPVMWTTTFDARSVVVGFTNTSGSQFFGGFVIVIRGSAGGVGASEKANQASGNAPSLALTTTASGSWIFTIVGDFDAADGASRTWRTIDSVTPTAANGFELLYFRDASRYTAYAAYYPGLGGAGAKTTGLTAPNMKPSTVSVEVKP